MMILLCFDGQGQDYTDIDGVVAERMSGVLYDALYVLPKEIIREQV